MPWGQGSARDGNPGRRPSVLRTVDRALAVLEVFSQRPAWSHVDIARATGIDRTIQYRLLATLEARGFVQRDPTTRLYEIGPALRALAGNDQLLELLTRFAEPEMRTLVESTGETARLAVLRGRDGVGVLQVESPKLLRASFPSGIRHSIANGAAGKAMLAFSPRIDQRIILDELRRIDRAQAERLGKDVEECQRRGWAESENEIQDGLAGIAAPVLGPAAAVLGAVSIVGPDSRFSPADRLRAVPRLLAATARISEGMGSPRCKLPA